MAQGFEEGEALFIALTKVTAKTISDDHVRLTDSFPTGNKAVIDVRIAPASTGDPDALKVKHKAKGGEFEFSVRYFVPIDAIPEDARPTFALGGPASGSVASLASFGVPAQGPEPSGFDVFAKGLVESQGGSKADEFLKEMDKKLKTPKLDKLNTKLKGAALVGELLAMGIDLNALLNELKALEECAKDPTNPLTKKAYDENPGAQDKLLKEIAGVRAELEGNTAAGVIGSINNFAAGFIEGGPSWLGHVMGPGHAWALDNFKKVAQDRMNEIRKGVPPCAKDLKVYAVLEGLWQLSGIKCGGAAGKWEIDGVLVGAPGGSGSEHITMTISGKSLSGPWSSTGSLTAAGKTIQINESGTATLTLSDDRTSGTLDFAPGSVPVTGGDFCKEVGPAGG